MKKKPDKIDKAIERFWGLGTGAARREIKRLLRASTEPTHDPRDAEPPALNREKYQEREDALSELLRIKSVLNVKGLDRIWDKAPAEKVLFLLSGMEKRDAALRAAETALESFVEVVQRVDPGVYRDTVDEAETALVKVRAAMGETRNENR